jgi:predicted O-methyltransferase YrrM
MSNKLFKVIPKLVRRRLYKAFLAHLYESRMNELEEIQAQEIENDYIANTRILKNRDELLKLLPKNGIVAEIGVDEGEYSKMILDICEPKKLHLIDLWGGVHYNQSKRVIVEKKFSSEIESGLVEINMGYSVEVVDSFEDEYFDWIYIDTDHTYTTTLQELKLYSLKIKPGGIMAGHDFTLGDWVSLRKYGVVEAVYEFCNTNNWEIIYLTAEFYRHPSFALKKMSK